METEQTSTMNKLGPGASLREARELLGLAPKDVAQALYLTTEHILEIERDDYSRTLGLTFERGYLRSYARLVNLQEDQVIAAFNCLALTEAQDALPAGMYMKPITKKPLTLRWLSLSGILLLFVLLVLWWQNQNSIVAMEDFKAESFQTLTAAGAQTVSDEEEVSQVMDHSSVVREDGSDVA